MPVDITAEVSALDHALAPHINRRVELILRGAPVGLLGRLVVINPALYHLSEPDQVVVKSEVSAVKFRHE